MAKHDAFRSAYSVPIIIAGAGVQAAGRDCTRMAEHLDICPMLIGMCRRENSPSTPLPQSIVPLLQDPDTPLADVAITQVTRRSDSGFEIGYSIRSARFR